MSTAIATEKSIWILEDDKGCQFVYEQTLDHRYKTRYFDSLESFENALKESNDRPQMLVADLMLGDGNFLNFLTNSSDVDVFNLPFIIVSSIDDVDALRFCFKEGALDYLTKPFKKNELLVKVENVISNQKKDQSPLVQINHRSVTVDGTQVENLTSKQMQLLSLFLESEQRAVTRIDILEKVWGDTTVHPKTVDVHLYNLRRKLHSYGYMIRSDGGGRWSLLADRLDRA